MSDDLLDKLAKLGLSEYEAKAYLALLRESPVTGYQLAKLSGVPRSMIYEVLSKLTARGAAMTLRQEDGVRYAPVPADDFLNQLHREQDKLISTLKGELAHLDAETNLEHVWNIEGHDNIMARVEEMINQAQERIYIALLPATFPALRPALEQAVRRGVWTVVYSGERLDLPGGQVVASPIPEKAAKHLGGLGLIIVVDSREALIGEMLAENRARASWTGSPLFVFVAEHHLRTDMYLPQVLALLGDKALTIIREEDWELFAHALESRLHD